VNNLPGCVLDASALIALLRDEPGADVVEQALARRAAISVINWAETLSKLADAGERPEDVAQGLRGGGVLGSDLTLEAISEDLAVDIARLRPLTRALGLSLGDRACLALGRAMALPVLTTERIWTELALDVEVVLIR
jgi:PIN domain nuclease of toxin-antitoxin system